MDLTLRSKTALISVSNKKGIVKFAKSLDELGWNFIASPGTAKALKKGGIKTSTMENLTGIANILDHRVFSEHIRIAGGLVATPSKKHDKDREKYGIPWFDLLCVDLYPLDKKINECCSEDEVVEATDIGGITLIRNAVKGRRIVLTQEKHRGLVLASLKREGDVSKTLRRKLWYDAETYCATYCLSSAHFLAKGEVEGMIGTVSKVLKYGENPYQSKAALFKTDEDPLGLSNFDQLSGTTPSYVNITSLSELVEILSRVSEVFHRNFLGRRPFIAIGSKHGIVVGAGIHWNLPNFAIKRMFWSNPKVIWGGEVILNFPITKELSQDLFSSKKRQLRLGSSNWMLDLIAAPRMEKGAVAKLGKRDKRRLFVNPHLKKPTVFTGSVFRKVRGGFISQNAPDFIPGPEDLKDVQGDNHKLPFEDILLAWALACSTHMNGVALVRDGSLLACDGQPSSVDAIQSCIVKMKQTGHNKGPLVFAANAFFPFTDSAELLVKNGAIAGILPRGGQHEKEVERFFTERGTSLIFLREEFRGFSRH